MVLVEHLPRVRDVEHVVRALASTAARRSSRDTCAPRRTRATSPTAAAAPQLAPRAREHRLGQSLRLQLRRELVGVVAVLAAKLAMDRLELLLQIELALVLEQRAAHVVVDLPLELEQVDLARERLAERAEQGGEVADRQQPLPPIEPRAEVRRDAERLPRRRVRALNQRDELRRKPPMNGDVLLEQRERAAQVRLGVVVCAEREWRHGLDDGAQAFAAGT